MLILRRSCEFSLSLQVGLRLYDDLNERMSREEATRIRDFVTTEALKVSLRNKTKCTGKIAFKTCFAKVWLGVSWKPKFFVEFKIISAKFFVSRNKKMLFCRHRFFLVFLGMLMLKLMPILLTVPPQQISWNIFVFQINPGLEEMECLESFSFHKYFSVFFILIPHFWLSFNLA